MRFVLFGIMVFVVYNAFQAWKHHVTATEHPEIAREILAITDQQLRERANERAVAFMARELSRDCKVVDGDYAMCSPGRILAQAQFLVDAIPSSPDRRPRTPKANRNSSLFWALMGVLLFSWLATSRKRRAGGI